jgi:hypothetical protein
MRSAVRRFLGDIHWCLYLARLHVEAWLQERKVAHFEAETSRMEARVRINRFWRRAWRSAAIVSGDMRVARQHKHDLKRLQRRAPNELNVQDVNE